MSLDLKETVAVITTAEGCGVCQCRAEDMQGMKPLRQPPNSASGVADSACTDAKY